MNRKLVLCALMLGIGLVAWAQGRASMNAPVIKGDPDVFTLVTQFTDFTPGANYRIGVGGADADLTGLKLEIQLDGGALSHPLTGFTQGYTNSWWNVAEVKAQGFVFEKSEFGGKILQLKLTVPRGAAEAAGRIFVFVAKDYGSETWYLEDGAAIDRDAW